MKKNSDLDKKQLDEDLVEVEKSYQRLSVDDFVGFLRGLVIPSAVGPMLFNSCMQQFQKDCFESLAPSIRAVRDGRVPPNRRFWIERTKKAGKDSDLAIIVLWLMAFPRRPFKCQICAANHRQARIIENRAVELLHYNPWLNEKVIIVQGVIRNKKSPREVWTHVEATDSSGGAHGETPDLLILNELVHVARWRAMEDHMNNADGVPLGVVIISTNAGVKGTKAWLWRQSAFEDKKRWTSHVWNQTAPWIGKDDVEDAKRRDPIGAEFQRLWKGRWVSGSGGAVEDEAIDRCFRLRGPLAKPESGWEYLAGLDLGVSHDHSGVVLVGLNEMEQRIKVAWIKGWEPSVPNDHGKLEVDGNEVEKACERLSQAFRISWFGYDPAAGGSFMAQRLRRKGVMMREVTFSSPKNCTDMAVSFVQSVKDGKLECYEDDEGRLRRDFGKFNIVHKPPSSYKLEAVSDEYGHADVGTALIICLPEAMRRLGRRDGALQKGDVLATPEEDNKPLDDKERNRLPPELRDIYDLEDEEQEKYRYGKRGTISGEEF